MTRTEAPLLDRCEALGAKHSVALTHVVDTLEQGIISGDEVDLLRTDDGAHPYGRRVLFATDSLEAMMASWTRGFPCEPHDHGGSAGAVRVLQGRARHRIWRVVSGRLVLEHEHTAAPGDVLCCGPDMVHSMADDGAPENLVTLHLYTGPIDYMVVYDVPNQRTLVVDGGCGAWIPETESGLIRRTFPSIIAPSEVERALASG